MYKRFISALSAAIFGASLLGFSVVSIAEENKQNIEDMVEKPQGDAVTDLAVTESKRAKLTEEQVIAQLKYMMITAFKRNEEALLERG